MTASPDLGTQASPAPTELPAAAHPEGAVPVSPGSAAGEESPASDVFGSDAFRSVFRRHAAGVAVITAAGTRPVGFTATSLTSVSAEPPLVSFGISTTGSAWRTVADAAYLGVHILGEHQEDLAATFARSGADRFAPPTAWAPGPYGVPLLEDVSAWLVARVVSRIPAGDHRVVIAQAVAGAPDGPARPLLYHQGRFNTLRH
ncbi:MULTISPECIES: flavin reductase family protein [unclassified Streptomyces]|uniref:flavin reductase family protein n=1 Tax=unclassified Streptomyces TaxID=2593676 RepID=UPI00380E8F75